MTRKRFYWKFRNHILELGTNTLIVAVLNLTPDSFSDGGDYTDADVAAARALELEEQGADIIDIGAESTRPGSERVSEAEELRRLIPVLKRLKGTLSIPISVDTYKAGVADLALEHGASIINDVSGLTWEPELVRVIAKREAGLVLNHMRGTPQTWAKLPPMRNVMGEIAAELEASLHRAVRSGIPADHIVIDPGIGFGKRKEQNSEILARLTELRRLPVAVLVGASRKSFLSQDKPQATEFATAAAVTAAILNGASLVRVHDVAAMKPVLAVTDAILAAVPESSEAPETRVTRREENKAPTPVFGDTVPKRPVRPPTPARTDDPRKQPLMARPVEPAKPTRPVRQDRPEGRPAPPRPRYEDREPRRETRPPDRPARRSNDTREDRPKFRGDRPLRDDRPGRSGDRPPRFERGRPPADRPAARPQGGRPPSGSRSASGPGDRRGPSFRPGQGSSRTGPPRQGPPRGGPPREGPPREDRADRPPQGSRGPRPPRSGSPAGPRKRSGPQGSGGGRRGPNTPPRRRT